jgi:hypothetical protein
MFIDEDIFGFDVAVDDALIVGVLEGIADLGDDGEGFLGGDVAGVKECAERHAIDVFHEEVGEGSGTEGMRRGGPEGRGAPAEFVEGDDVGVIEEGEGLRFVGETFGESPVAPSSP